MIELPNKYTGWFIFMLGIYSILEMFEKEFYIPKIFVLHIISTFIKTLHLSLVMIMAVHWSQNASYVPTSLKIWSSGTCGSTCTMFIIIFPLNHKNR